MNYLESVENDKELSGNESTGQSGNGTAMPRLNRSPMNSKYVALIVHSNSKKNIFCFSFQNRGIGLRVAEKVGRTSGQSSIYRGRKRAGH